MIGILVSLKKEIEPFLEALTDVHRRRVAGCTLWEGSFKDVSVRVVVTGIGKDVPALTLDGCGVVVSTGFCGALRPDMTCGDLVLSNEVAFAGEEILRKITSSSEAAGRFEGTGLFRLSISGHVREHLSRLARQRDLSLHVGRSVTCARVIRSEAEKRRLERYFDAHAVDMEDFLRIGRARRIGIEVLCVRAVFDEIKDTVPSFRGGLHLRGASSLLRKIPSAQKSISLMLNEIVPFLVDTMEIGGECSILK